MDDDKMVSQLPMGSKLRLYGRGVLAFMPPWAVSAASMLGAVAYGLSAWSHQESFALLDLSEWMTATVFLGLTALGWPGMLRYWIEGWGKPAAPWRRTLTLAMALGLASVLSSAWMQGEIPKLSTAVDEPKLLAAYAADVEAMRAAGAPAGVQAAWERGGVLRLFHFKDGAAGAELMHEAWRSGATWPAVDDVRRIAQRRNFYSLYGQAASVVFGISMLDALAMPLLAWVAWSLGCIGRGAARLGSRSGWEALARQGRSAIRKGARVAIACLSAPKAALAGAQWAGAGAKRMLEQAALKDPQQRADFEREAIVSATGHAQGPDKEAKRL